MKRKKPIYRKPKPGEPVRLSARQLNLLVHERQSLEARHYKDLRGMVLIDSTIEEAKKDMEECDDTFLLDVWDPRQFGRGKRIVVWYDGQDKDHYYFIVAYVPKVIRKKDIDESIIKTFRINRWSTTKSMLYMQIVEKYHE